MTGKRFQIGNKEEYTQTRRGVKQGDPLSSQIFNLVLSSSLESLLCVDVGREIDGTRINTLAYADDVVLVASTRKGLQTNLDHFQSAISDLGMEINIGKSATLSLVPLGKEKR